MATLDTAREPGPLMVMYLGELYELPRPMDEERWSQIVAREAMWSSEREGGASQKDVSTDGALDRNSQKWRCVPSRPSPFRTKSSPMPPTPPRPADERLPSDEEKEASRVLSPSAGKPTNGLRLDAALADSKDSDPSPGGNPSSPAVFPVVTPLSACESSPSSSILLHSICPPSDEERSRRAASLSRSDGGRSNMRRQPSEPDRFSAFHDSKEASDTSAPQEAGVSASSEGSESKQGFSGSASTQETGGAPSRVLSDSVNDAIHDCGGMEEAPSKQSGASSASHITVVTTISGVDSKTSLSKADSIDKEELLPL